MYINYIIVFHFYSIIMYFYIGITCRKSIMSFMSNGVTKHPDFWEAYS